MLQMMYECKKSWKFDFSPSSEKICKQSHSSNSEWFTIDS